MARKKKVDTSEAFFPQQEADFGPARDLIEQNAEYLTQLADEQDNEPFNAEGKVERGEVLYRQDLDPRRHTWGGATNEPVYAVEFSQVAAADADDLTEQEELQVAASTPDTNDKG